MTSTPGSRRHRVPPGRPAFVPWIALKEQFGWHYTRLDHFRPVFRQTLETVLTQYRGARVELDEGGLTLRHPAPPVKGRLAVTRGG